MNAKNCATLSEKPNIDGFLVGGASLIGPDFVTICSALPKEGMAPDLPPDDDVPEVTPVAAPAARSS